MTTRVLEAKLKTFFVPCDEPFTIHLSWLHLLFTAPFNNANGEGGGGERKHLAVLTTWVLHTALESKLSTLVHRLLAHSRSSSPNGGTGRTELERRTEIVFQFEWDA